jgi:3-hydroxyisobutyrate dehydrogenase-like beta-hydroxyacid dehydrogenase
MSQLPSVGYIGLGLMGKSIARNILKAGFPLVVHNRSRNPVDELVSEGAVAATSPADVARQVEIVMTCLPDSPDVEEVAIGPSGIVDGSHPGLIFVDNSTIKPTTSRRIAAILGEKGVQCLDAPLSGGDIGARQGTLAIMVGGPAEALERVMPVFQAMGKTITYVGEAGAGQIAKAANQIMTAAQMVALSELLIFSQKAGADPRKVVEALRGCGPMLDIGCQAASSLLREPRTRIQGLHACQRPGDHPGYCPRIWHPFAICRLGLSALPGYARDGDGQPGYICGPGCPGDNGRREIGGWAGVIGHAYEAKGDGFRQSTE